MNGRRPAERRARPAPRRRPRGTGRAAGTPRAHSRADARRFQLSRSALTPLFCAYLDITSFMGVPFRTRITVISPVCAEGRGAWRARGGRGGARGGGRPRAFLLCARTVIMPSSSSVPWDCGELRSVFSTSRMDRDESRWPMSSLPAMSGRMTKPGAEVPEFTESVSRTEGNSLPCSEGVGSVDPAWVPKPDIVDRPRPPAPSVFPGTVGPATARLLHDNHEEAKTATKKISHLHFLHICSNTDISERRAAPASRSRARAAGPAPTWD